MCSQPSRVRHVTCVLCWRCLQEAYPQPEPPPLSATSAGQLRRRGGRQQLSRHQPQRHPRRLSSNKRLQRRQRSSPSSSGTRSSHRRGGPSGGAGRGICGGYGSCATSTGGCDQRRIRSPGASRNPCIRAFARAYRQRRRIRDSQGLSRAGKLSHVSLSDPADPHSRQHAEGPPVSLRHADTLSAPPPQRPSRRWRGIIRRSQQCRSRQPQRQLARLWADRGASER